MINQSKLNKLQENRADKDPTKFSKAMQSHAPGEE